MIIKSKSAGYSLLLLFLLSGFAGLIYQSIWSHYLGLTLGHAAYAQTLVLAIFMGGMALGAWSVSRKTLALRHLILAYAIVEFVIGVIGTAFHPMFDTYMRVSQQDVLPALSHAWAAHAYQWISAGLLIAPQSILMGATFPLLSAGYLRIAPQEQGEVLGGLYFTNSLGAAMGALTTTFVLLPAVGMPGSILGAGLINIAVGIGAWAVWKMLPHAEPKTSLEAKVAISPAQGTDRVARILFFSAFLTGATSFVYEIGWVRMLNQALGTTVHSFELMLAAFILGLALGGLWVRRKSASIDDAIRYGGYAQILMGIAALLSLVLFAHSFQWVGWLLRTIARSDDGYSVFMLGSAVISMMVMLPAAFFAGMTLPLFTVALLRRGAGESSIGRIYASNTLGAIVGVFLTVHLLIPFIGVRLAVTFAALIDVGLGLYLLRCVSPGRRTIGYGVAAFASLLITAFSLSAGRVDPLAQSSGVFRTGESRLPEGMKVPYLRDGKTATVSVVSYQNGAYAMIGTNGKPDAALATRADLAPTPDEITMIMAGALPLALHPHPDRVAVIGWGSGLTVHTLLGSPLPKSVDTIEIEKAMYEGARTFGPRVARAYSDPRSVVRIDDARTYFSTGGRKFDVVISEPSNPWVSGVASLFTSEFYAFVQRHLAEDGLLVQWLHTYEIDDPLVATMVAALLKQFPEVSLYVTNSGDLLFVAGTSVTREPHWMQLSKEPLASELRRVGFSSPADLQMRYIGDRRVLEAFVKLNRATVHSDYFPTVSLLAPRSRFRRSQSLALQILAVNGMPVLDILTGRKPPLVADVSKAADSMIAVKMMEASYLKQAMTGGTIPSSKTDDPSNGLYLQTLLSLSKNTLRKDQIELWSLAAANIADDTLGILSAEEQAGMWVNPAWMPDTSVQPVVVQQIMRAYSAAARRDHKEMRLAALAVLHSDRAVVADYALEQMVVIAELGAIGDGDPAAVRTIDEEGKNIPSSLVLGYIRNYLLTWSAVPVRR